MPVLLVSAKDIQ